MIEKVKPSAKMKAIVAKLNEVIEYLNTLNVSTKNAVDVTGKLHKAMDVMEGKEKKDA